MFWFLFQGKTGERCKREGYLTAAKNNLNMIGALSYAVNYTWITASGVETEEETMEGNEDSVVVVVSFPSL